MRVHFSTENGISSALEKAFEVVESRPASESTFYFNCTSSEPLRKAVQKGGFSWLQEKEKLQNFHYEHVADLPAFCTKIDQIQRSGPESNLIIVEQIDHIVSQPCTAEYYEQNEALTRALQKLENVIFLDSWGFLDKYHVLSA